MALTALISWVGVTVRPLELYFKTNFFSQTTVFSVIGLSLLVLGRSVGFLTVGALNNTLPKRT